MKLTNWILGACLSVLLLAGMAAEMSAQQPAAPPDSKQSESTPSQSQETPRASEQTAPAPGAQNPGAQTSPGPSVTIDRQIETRTERVEREPATFLGIDATVAMVVGAVLVVVVVLGLVAMSRREDHPHHTRV